jgi:hypothetical protein
MTQIATLPVPKASPKVRTFHKDGAVEVRATILTKTEEGERRIDVHILDAEGVVAALREAGNVEGSAALSSLLATIEDLADEHPDAAKLEITPQNLTGEPQA